MSGRAVNGRTVNGLVRRGRRRGRRRSPTARWCLHLRICMRRRSPVLLALRGISYHTESGHEIKVCGLEIRGELAKLAACNGWRVEELLTNAAVLAGEPLPCRVVKRVPQGWSLTDTSGYIMMRFSQAKSVREQSFAGETSADKVPDFVPTRRLRKRTTSSMQEGESATAGDPPTSPCLPQRPRPSYSTYLTSSPPPESQIGANQPLIERYHRVMYAASMATNELPDGWVLHACGNKRCAVVAHLYLGGEPSNNLDTKHHRKKPKTSRLSLQKMQ